MFIPQDVTDFLVWRDHVSSRPDILSLPEFKPTANFYIAEKVAKRLSDEELNNKSIVGEPEGVGNLHDCLAVNASRLFLVLPTNLGSWNDLDPSTHSSRLYFLCDYDYERGDITTCTHTIFTSPTIQDMILTDLQSSCHFALTILEAAMNVSNDDECYIPNLASFRILNNCKGVAVQHQLTRHNLQLLVETAIVFIHALLP